jgi:hypothetical protein
MINNEPFIEYPTSFRLRGLTPNSFEQLAFISIREYCLHSWLYYTKDTTLISDGEYDELCKWLLENYEWVKPFDINNYLCKDLLACGSGYGLQLKGLTLKYCEDVYKDMQLNDK